MLHIAGVNPPDQERPSSALEVIRPGVERAGVAAAATIVPSLLLVHGLAALFHTAPGISPAAVSVSYTVIVVGLIHALMQWRLPRLPIWGWLVTPLAAAVLLAITAGSLSGALAVAVCGAIQGWAQSRVAHALPSSIDGRISKCPWRAIAWSLLAILAVVQTARLANHEADPSNPWWVTSENPAWTSHQCLSAYVYAADAHEQEKANIYDESHYLPSEDPNAGPQPTVENLAGLIECPFQYPPPFLALPWAALQVTNDFNVIRPIWFAFQGLGFLAVAVMLGLWVGGPRGRLALWLIPAVWIAVPTLQNFQFGQFHLTAFALAVAGMLAFETRRITLGGALLGAAVVTKIYPGILLVFLVAQRRWRELGITLAWIIAFAILGLVLLGTVPYEAFIHYQLPNLLDGSAFDSATWDTAVRDMLTAIRVGVSAIPGRLSILGMTFLPDRLGPWLGRLFGLAILVLVWRAGRRTTSRSHAVILWLALLNLVVLQAPAAFVDYTTATSVWLLAFVSVDMARSRLTAVGLGICWLQFATLLGTFPIPDKPSADWLSALSAAHIAAATLVMTLLLLALNLWCAMRSDPDAPGASGTLPQGGIAR